jgi:hypothetical protein
MFRTVSGVIWSLDEQQSVNLGKPHQLQDEFELWSLLCEFLREGTRLVVTV